MEPRIHQSWTELENYQLWLGFNKHISIKVLANFFRRTPSAVNKYLSRSGIRKDCGLRAQDKLQPIIKNSIKDMEQVILEYGLDKDTVTLEMQSTRQWQPSSHTLEKMAACGFKHPGPWSPRRGIQSLPATMLSRYLLDEPITVSMPAAYQYARQQGIAISSMNGSPTIRSTYMLNGRPTSARACLISINHKRIERGEPIFWIDGLTED